MNKATAINIFANGVRAATVTGADVDVVQRKGYAMAMLTAAAQGSGITSTVKLQASPVVAEGEKYDTVGDQNIALRTGAANNVLLAAKFTKDGAASIKQIVLPLRQKGTITSGDVWVTILADSSGPNGAALATSAKISAASLAAAYAGATFTFATPLDLADESAYWIVLQGDFTASATNQVEWRGITLVSGGNVATNNGTTWTADATKSLEFSNRQFEFADVVAFTAVGNAASMQTKPFKIDSVGGVLRGVSTVAGGSATGAISLVVVVE